MKIKKRIFEWKTALLYYLYRVKPIDMHKVVFCNYNGKGYGCNPKYIAEALIRRHPDWDYVWLVENDNMNFPKEIRTVKYNSNESIYELATAGVWIDNQRKLWFHRKRKKQFFIETWHGGGIPMKKIGIDNPNNVNNKPYEHTSKHMNKIANVMITNSDTCAEAFKKAFLYTHDMVVCGYPRSDILLGELEPYREKVRKYYNLNSNDNIILYAPTYRNGRKLDKYDLDYERIIEAFEEKYGGNWKLFLRLHPSMRNKSKDIQHNDKVIDTSLYEDMQELLAASDVVISDYSSIVSEFALTKKPIFLYANDIDEYSKERDFYCDYFALPFSIAKTNEELIKNIKEFKLDGYSERIDECFKKYGVKETGKASESIADMIDKAVNL